MRAEQILFWHLLLILLCGYCALTCANVLKEGDNALARGDYSEAVQRYSTVIDQEPPSALLYTKRAAAYISLRQQSQALKDLDKALELDGTYVQSYLSRGKVYRQLCNLNAAEKDFNKVLEMRRGHKVAVKELEATQTASALLQQAKEHSASGARASALGALNQLYELAPDCVPAQLLEAQLQLDAQEYEQVVAATGRLLKIDAKNIEALTLRGRAYFYLNENDIAKRHFGEALKYDPDFALAQTEFKKVKELERTQKRAQSAEKEDNWTGAESAYSAALHIDADHRKGNLPLWIGLCKARYHLGRIDAALEACDNALILDRNNEEAKSEAVRALLKAERWQDAVTRARTAASEHRGSHTLRQLLAEAEKQMKMSQRKDYYKILNVAKDASERDIKRAYRELAKIHHPDKVSNEEKEAAEERFREIAEAYEVLSDSEKRSRYDNGEDLQEPQQGGGHGFPGHGFPGFFHQGQGQRTFRFNFG